MHSRNHKTLPTAKHINFITTLSHRKAIENECHFPTPCRTEKKELKFLKCQRKAQLPNPKMLQLKIGTASDITAPCDKKFPVENLLF